MTPLPRPRGERFEDSDRWARGRLLAALVAGEHPPPLDAGAARAGAGRARPRRAGGARAGRRAAAAVRRVALTLRADAVEAVLDVLMPLLPQGVYERVLDPERTEVAFFGDGHARRRRARLDRRGRAARPRGGGGAGLARGAPAPCRARVDGGGSACGSARPTTRRRRTARSRSIIEPAPGAFGTGAHPTTRGCLELLLELEPGGGLADLGCGSGVVAIAGAQLGWEPVYGLDFDERSVAATERNAQRNGVAVRAVLADLREIPAPPAHTLVANIPLDVHERVAGSLSPATARVIVSGITASQEAAATRGLRARRAGAAGPPGRGRVGRAVAGAGVTPALLDPGRAAAAGAPHGQLASAMAAARCGSRATS